MMDDRKGKVNEAGTNKGAQDRACDHCSCSKDRGIKDRAGIDIDKDTELKELDAQLSSNEDALLIALSEDPTAYGEYADTLFKHRQKMLKRREVISGQVVTDPCIAEIWRARNQATKSCECDDCSCGKEKAAPPQAEDKVLITLEKQFKDIKASLKLAFKDLANGQEVIEFLLCSSAVLETLADTTSLLGYPELTEKIVNTLTKFVHKCNKASEKLRWQDEKASVDIQSIKKILQEQPLIGSSPADVAPKGFALFSSDSRIHTLKQAVDTIAANRIIDAIRQYDKDSNTKLFGPGAGDKC